MPTSEWLKLGTAFAVGILCVWAVRRTMPMTMLRTRRALGNLFTPFSVIASELQRMNDLKTLELAERLNPKTGELSPVIPITEEPSKHDTEVFFGVGDEGKMSLKERLVAQFEREAEDE